MILKKIGFILTSALLSIMISATTMQAQNTYRSSDGQKKSTKAAPAKKGFDLSRLIYGGGLYGGGGNQMISLGVSPIVGYAITDFWSAGVSLGYQYTFQRDYFPVYDYDWQKMEYYNLNNHVFVPGVWTRLKVFRNFFTHFEFEHLISTYKGHGNDQNGYHYSERITESVPCLLLGGGLRQPINERSSFVIYALYDVLQNMESNQRTINGVSYSMSPYANRVDIRVGLNIGF